MGVSKTSHHIQIKIKILNPSQEPQASPKTPKTIYHIQINIKRQNSSQKPPASFKAPKEDLKDMNVICTLKIKTERKILNHGYIKDH